MSNKVERSQEVPLEKIELDGLFPYYDEPYPEMEDDKENGCCCLGAGCLPIVLMILIFLILN